MRPEDFFTNPLFDAIAATFGRDVPTPVEIIFAMVLSFSLNLLVGAVYKATYRGTGYSQNFVQALVIIGTVTSILIMVVSGNMGVAFGMFAAFSMIRFRSNLGQSRDLGFVFFAMATGMVVGARYYSMAVITTLVVAAVIAVLTRIDAFAPKRASHRLLVRVTNDINFDSAFAPIFDAYAETVELFSVESVQAGMMTEIRYGLQLKPGTVLREFIEKLQLANGNNRVLITSNQRALES